MVNRFIPIDKKFTKNMESYNKINRRIIEISFLEVMFLLTSLSVLAQPSIVEPGDKSINPALLNSGKFTWGTEKIDEARLISVQRSNQEITIETRNTKKEKDQEKYTLVLNAKTLEPIRHNYTGEEVSYNFQYGARVKGTRTIFETNEKETLNEAITGKFFDNQTVPFVISSLPLSVDYRAIVPAIGLNSSFKPVYFRYRITDVSEGKTFSCRLGYRDFWKVTAKENKSELELTLYIDKETRRIMRAEYNYISTLSTYKFGDKETDINPIKAAFNAVETKAMLSGGNSTIKGQASTKDGMPKSILQKGKSIYAPKGSLVALIPNTPYFKEWVDFNLYIGKISPPLYMDGGIFGISERLLVQGCAYPLPTEVRQQMLLTDVIDDKGNFVFQNLRPGEYLVFVGFVANKYSHTTKTPNGYSVTVYPDGSASGGTTYDVKHWVTPKNVVNLKFVNVSKEGETINVKLN